MRERLLRKLWYLFEINVKVEILRYWWIEEKSTIPFSNALMFTNAPRHLFSNHTVLQTNHTGKLVMSGDLSGIQLDVM